MFCFQVLPETVVNFTEKNIFHFISTKMEDFSKIPIKNHKR